MRVDLAHPPAEQCPPGWLEPGHAAEKRSPYQGGEYYNFNLQGHTNLSGFLMEEFENEIVIATGNSNRASKLYIISKRAIVSATLEDRPIPPPE